MSKVADAFCRPSVLIETQLYVSGKLSTFPSPKPKFRPKWEISVNVNLGEG